MRVLVIGGGGREHAILWKLSQSPMVEKIYCIPGNGGMAELAKCVPGDISDIDFLVDFAKEYAIHFTVVGPELPLALGVVDAFQRENLEDLRTVRGGGSAGEQQGICQGIYGTVRHPHGEV